MSPEQLRAYRPGALSLGVTYQAAMMLLLSAAIVTFRSVERLV
jgi:hypothetical protein